MIPLKGYPLWIPEPEICMTKLIATPSSLLVMAFLSRLLRDPRNISKEARSIAKKHPNGVTRPIVLPA